MLDFEEINLDTIKSLPLKEKHLLLDMFNNRSKVKSKKNFLSFVKQMWPEFISGRHHAKIAKAFERVAQGKTKRLIINMPPRHTKSEFASYLLPAWFLGQFPQKKVIQTSHTAELAVGFGRKVRNLVGGQEAVIAETNPEVYDKVYEWYTSGPRQRLQPGGSIVIVMTRWAKRDLTGQVIKASSQHGGDEWEVIEFPALFPSGNPLWPEFWSKKELESLKTQLPLSKWQAQYQQAPTSEEGALIKREWWNAWENDNPPPCEFIIQSWDTAFLKSNRADYSACTTWGVFYHTDPDTGKQSSNIILLDAYRKRMEFPELKEVTYEMYQEWKPDALIVEAKAAGAPLVFELRSMGVPVSEFTPTRGNDKIARVNAVTDLFASGIVWAPPSRWAEEVIEEIAAFPSGDHDDYVDSTTQALLRFRQGGFVRLQSDEEDEEIPWYRKRKAAYY